MKTTVAYHIWLMAKKYNLKQISRKDRGILVEAHKEWQRHNHIVKDTDDNSRLSSCSTAFKLKDGKKYFRKAPELKNVYEVIYYD